MADGETQTERVPLIIELQRGVWRKKSIAEASLKRGSLRLLVVSPVPLNGSVGVRKALRGDPQLLSG
jgi:hypothetical protein